MPKKPPRNSFFFFMLDFKRKEESKGRYFTGGMRQVSMEASPHWNKMTPQQKGPYEKKAKDEKYGGGGSGSGERYERYTSQGIPFSQIEKQQQSRESANILMKKTIANMVNESFMENTITTKEYIFVAGNYFCKTHEQLYIPAEISLLKYSLLNGVGKSYHTFIKSSRLPTGYAYEAKIYSTETHHLPPPPNSMGEENFVRINKEIIEFVADGNNQNAPLPPIFTDHTQIPMLRSFFDQFCELSGEDPEIYRIYPTNELFFKLKETTSKFAEIETHSFISIHIAQAMLDRDLYDYKQGIACAFHDEEDASKYCTLSYVRRWAFTFSDHLCQDVSVTLEENKHLPSGLDLAGSVYDDTKSIGHGGGGGDDSDDDYDIKSTVTHLTEPIKYTADTDDQHSMITSASTSRSSKPNSRNLMVNLKDEGDADDDDDDDDDADFQMVKFKRSKPREPSQDIKFKNPANGSYNRGLGNGRICYDDSDSVQSSLGRGRGRRM